MKNEMIFPLETIYVKIRDDQIGLTGRDIPLSNLSLSIKSQVRQYPLGDGWFFDDRFQLILGQMKRRTMDDFVRDIYLFPLNPAADPFESARLIEGYIRSGDQTPIKQYFKKTGVKHLQDHNLNYYPVYYLFFLMTRFASYPFDQNQLYLIEKRAETKFQSPVQQFIDSVFEYEIYQLDTLIQLIDRIEKEGPVSVGIQFGTNHEDWVGWADEYLQNEGVENQPIDNISDLTQNLVNKLLTWSDFQIEDLCLKLELTPPMRKEHPTRISYINQIAGAIGK
jgi:hypothetical protein